MSCMRRASSCPSQAKLLRGRGDLNGQRTVITVKLDKPNPMALQAEKPLDRMGFDLRRAKSTSRLLVAAVDKNPRKKTPVARWNEEEERNADRGEDERRASYALLPGDRLLSVNGVNGQTAMLSELVDATDYTSPKAVDLAFSRNIADVMQPSPVRMRNALAPPPSRPSTKVRQDLDFTTLCAPPRSPEKLPPCVGATPPRSIHSSSSSRSTSACGTRSNSACSSRRSSFSAASGVSVSLSHAGRMALAF